MADWKADEGFLDYLVKRMEQKGNSTDAPLVGDSQGGYNFKDLVEQMRAGTPIGKKLYDSLFQEYQQDFGKYKAQQNP